MARIISTLILVVVVIAVQGQAPEYEEVIKAAKAGNWDQVQELEQPYGEIQASYNEDDSLNSNLGKQAGWKPPSFNSLRELKPENGGHVYGEAEYAYHSASNVNGRTTEQNAGHKIINEDGRVKEYDFTPSTSYAPHIPSIISPVGQKAGDYVASDYHYQYGGSVSGKPNFASQKLNNNLPQDYYPRNSAVVPIPPKKQPNSTNSPDVEYEYVLISSTEDDKPPREINVSEENKFNVLNGAEQDNEIAQTNDQVPVSYKNAGEDENYNNGLKYNIDFDEPPEAKQRPKITMMTTEPQFLLRVAEVGRKLKTTPPTTGAADDYIYNIPPVFLEDEKFASNSNKENKIKKINKDTQIVITFGDEPTDNPAPVTPDVPTPSQIPIANLFSNIDYMAGPAVTDRSFIKFKNNDQEKNKKTTIARNRSKMSDADYMAYVASAIEDGLDKMTQHIKKRDFEKLYSDMISSPTKAARKERSQKFLEKKPLFPNSFDKKFAYKNSSSYLDSKPPHIQKNEFRTSTPKADSALSFTNVRELKPPQGGHVYGEAQYAYHTASNINGQKSEDAGGHKIINNDGKVKEFDFTPKPISGPLKKLPLAVLDKDIGALKSLFLQ